MHKYNYKFYFNSIQVNLSSPQADSVNAVEIWMLCCVVMVYAALSEYGLILSIKFGKGIPLEKINHRPKCPNHTGNTDHNSKQPTSNRDCNADGKMDLYFYHLYPKGI